MRRFLFAAALAAAPASAQPVSEAGARDLLFGTRGEAIALSQALSEQEKAILREVIRLTGEQMRQPLRYYASIAYSPDEGLVSEALQSSSNHHGVAAADRAALAACNAARAEGTQPCQIGARVLPRGYESRPIELSLGATTAFDETYRGIRGEKALAVSVGTGQFAIARGPGAEEQAVARCNAAAGGANDCRVVVSD